MANDIVRQSEAPQVTGEAIKEAEEKAEFLNREVQYSHQLHGVLRGIQYVNELLSEVEAAKNERRILDSLRLLESTLLCMVHSIVPLIILLRIMGITRPGWCQQDLQSHETAESPKF